jgi:hypothetical protein
VTNRETEYATLRQTIASRGTARAIVCVVTMAVWASLATVHGLLSDLPLLVVLPLVPLAAGYEAVWSLHVGVERIGRFLQVVYEGDQGDPSWETIAMRAAPGLPGGGVNPLFTPLFGGAAIVNLGTAFVAEPTPLELILLFVAHTAFLLRLAQTRLLAGRQRRADLEAFQTAVGNAAAPTAVRGGAAETSSETKNS